MATPLIVSEVAKSFTMHLRGGLVLPVVSNVSFSVASGECVVLGGPSSRAHRIDKVLFRRNHRRPPGRSRRCTGVSWAASG